MSITVGAGATNPYGQGTTANSGASQVVLCVDLAPLPEYECGYCREPVVVHIDRAHWSWSHESDGTPLCAGPDGVAWLTSISAGRVTVDAVNDGGMW